MTNEQYIINACVANDPSIMELTTIGCRIFYNNPQLEGHIPQELSNGFVLPSGKIWWEVDEGATDTHDGIEKEEILGRDIYLHDVLGAIKKRADTLGWIKMMEKFNEIMDLDEWGNHSLYYAVIENWNLKKTLHEQTEETKLLLARIFGFKE